MSKPKVVIYGDVSVDGRLTLAPDHLLLFCDQRWEAVAPKSNVYDWLMFTHKPEAMMEGSNSFVYSQCVPSPLPPVRSNPRELYRDFLPEAVVHNAARQAWFTVMDSRGRIRWTYTGEPRKEAPGSEGQHLLVFVTGRTPPEYLAFLRRENVPYLIAGEDRVDLAIALEKLASRLGVKCVLSTSPGKLAGALLRAGLVDEVDIDFFPAIIGGTDTPALFQSPALKPDEWPTRLKLLAVQVQANGRVWLRYEVVQA